MRCTAVVTRRVLVDADQEVVCIVVYEGVLQGYIHPSFFLGKDHFTVEDFRELIKGHPVLIAVEGSPVCVSHIDHPVSVVCSRRCAVPVEGDILKALVCDVDITLEVDGLAVRVVIVRIYRYLVIGGSVTDKHQTFGYGGKAEGCSCIAFACAVVAFHRPVIHRVILKRSCKREAG